MLAGDDYKNWGNAIFEKYAICKFRIKKCQVKKAVNEFIENNNHNLNIITNKGKKNWFFIKNN